MLSCCPDELALFCGCRSEGFCAIDSPGAPDILRRVRLGCQSTPLPVAVNELPLWLCQCQSIIARRLRRASKIDPRKNEKMRLRSILVLLLVRLTRSSMESLKQAYTMNRRIYFSTCMTSSGPVPRAKRKPRVAFIFATATQHRSNAGLTHQHRRP